MNDLELTALAAKAIGLEIHESDDGTMQRRPIWCTTNYVMGQPYGESRWHPLGYDAHAFQLASKLGLVVEFGNNMVVHPIEIGGDGTDPLTATRRAIVQAAAEIGKTKDA